MQISVESCLALEHPYYRIDNFNIYLDGVMQDHVLELDTLGTLNEPRGWIRRYRTDRNGNVIIGLDGNVKDEIVYGNVEIKLKGGV